MCGIELDIQLEFRKMDMTFYLKISLGTELQNEVRLKTKKVENEKNLLVFFNVL